MVSWVDSEGKDLLPEGLPRFKIHQMIILHRGAGIFVRDGDKEGRVFVHRRSDEKLIFPSLYDMFVGGVSHVGESSEVTARRELKEELGLGKGPFQYLYSCLIETSYNRCFVDVYEYQVQEDKEEVENDHDEVQ